MSGNTIITQQLENVLESYNEVFVLTKSLIEKGSLIKIDSITQKKEMRESKEIRIKLKNIRVSAEKRKAEDKEEALVYCQALDHKIRQINDYIKPAEKELKDKEDYAVNTEKARVLKLQKDRMLELSQYDVRTHEIDLVSLSENDYQILLKNSIYNFDTEKERLEDEKKEKKILREKERLLLNRRFETAKISDYIPKDFVLNIDTTEQEFTNITLSAYKAKTIVELELENGREKALKKEKEEAEKTKTENEVKFLAFLLDNGCDGVDDANFTIIHKSKRVTLYKKVASIEI